MKKILWLDDYRDPFKNPDWLIFSPIGRDVEVHWVKSFRGFCMWIDMNGLPDGICFDHDLGDVNNMDPVFEKTGYHCAMYVVDYCEERGIDIPPYGIQSSNPVGREKIDSLLKSYHDLYLMEH